MFCEKCGKQMNEEALFCPHCGYKNSSAEEKSEAIPKQERIEVKRKSNVVWIVIIVILIAIIGGLVYSGNNGKSEKKTEYVIRDDETGIQ